MCTCMYDPVRKRVFHVQKRADNKYECNETYINSGYFWCPVAKLLLIMQDYINKVIRFYHYNDGFFQNCIFPEIIKILV